MAKQATAPVASKSEDSIPDELKASKSDSSIPAKGEPEASELDHADDSKQGVGQHAE